MSEDQREFVPYRVHAQRGIIDTPWFTVRVDEISYPDGRPGTYYCVGIPPSAVVLPVLDDGRIALIRQWRYTLQRDHLELPAGRIHAGETPLEAARRELREETGHRAGRLVPMPGFYPTNGISAHWSYLYAALDCEPEGALELDPCERLIVQTFTAAECEALLRAGRIEDGFSALALLYGRHFGYI